MTRPALPHLRRGAALLAALVASAAVLVLPAAPASADPRVGVDNDRGTGARADLRYRTTLTVSGSGFQSVRGGFGGVYVMFGWVDDPGGGSWRPSRGGLTGQDYRYIPDSETTADNRGYLKFVAFPGSSTAGEAHAVMSGSGAFRLDLTVPGPVFASVDRDGSTSEVDCRRVTCGVITVGAHGVTNPENESFTPVDFDTVYDEAPAPADAAPDGSGDAAAASAASPRRAGARAQEPAARAGRAGRASVTADRTTAVAGHALTFTGRGFAPGEQVVAVLDDGVAALGPMVAGTAGDVAGVLELPTGITAGTHELRLTGAASGTEVRERFPIRGNPGDSSGAVAVADVSATAGSDAAADPTAGPVRTDVLLLLGAALVFALTLALALTRRLRGRRGAAPTTVGVVG